MQLRGPLERQKIMDKRQKELARKELLVVQAICIKQTLMATI